MWSMLWIYQIVTGVTSVVGVPSTHLVDIDFGGGDADSVVLIAWHIDNDKSCVLLALLLYQESDINAKPLHFFVGGGNEWMMNG